MGGHDPSWLKTPADINELVPILWPRNVQRETDGAVRVSGVDVRQLAEEFGTPAYVFDEADFRSRCRDFRQAFAGADIFYAAKAFCSKTVVRIVAEEGLNLDVCTGGELAVALAAGMPPERIKMHGNNKSTMELVRAMDAGLGWIVVDSFSEIDRLTALARERGVRQRVMVRVTVGVEAHTHEFIATAHEDQKFGFSLSSGKAFDAAARIIREDILELAGLHSHIGSQIFDTSGFEVSARRVLALQDDLRTELGVDLAQLDLGGGFGIAYTAQDDPSTPGDLATRMSKIVEQECAARQLPVPHLSIEPGRALVGPAMFTLYEVGTVKDVDGIRTYVSVDGGMSDNIRSALYDAAYSASLVGRASAAPPMLARVVGKHCEAGDVVVKDEVLPADVRPGDLIGVPGTGA
jgi:diaminopimelate decarboxylase